MFFDNVQVTHTRGPLVQESHYYMYGLEMAAISSKAAGSLVNKDNTFQGQKIDDELGLNWYQFKWRNHDPQIGRFIEIDPLSDKYEYNSTYAFSENKVTNHVELEGLEAVSAVPQSGGNPLYYLAEGFRQMFQAAGNLFQGKAEVHINHEVEVKSEIATPVGKISNTTTTTVSENKLEIQTNFGDYFKNGGGNMVTIKGESNTMAKVENKTTATIKTSGAPLVASEKTTVDGNGKSTTISGGTAASVSVGKADVKVSANGFFTSQTSGKNAGQNTMGLKFAADATFVNKQYSTINTSGLKVTTSSQTVVGGSVTLQTKKTN